MSAPRLDPLSRDWQGRSPHNCDFCGRLMYGEFAQADVEGRVRRFCSAGCQELYATYWVPKYGADRTARIEDAG